MAQVDLNIHGRSFAISCEDGQESRVIALGEYVDARLSEISKAGAASSESHLLVLTTLLLADEVFDMRDDIGVLNSRVQGAESNENNEEAVAGAIEDLAGRIDQIAKRIQNA